MRCLRTTPVVLILVVLTLLLGCDGKRKAKSERRPSAPPTLESADFVEISPVADGGAYASTLGAVWYLREGQGVKVRGLPDDVFVSDIIPAADGGAYLVGSGEGTWYLRGSTATKVREVRALSGDIPTIRSAESWLWALLQREVARRKAAEEEARAVE